jgi:hypothetical protein
MKPVQTVVTAAGDSRSLFIGSGFMSPKSLVRRDGKTVIQRAVESYVVDRAHAVVAINQEEQRQWPIRQELELHFPEVDVFEVTSAAKGALVTALMVMGGLDADLPLVVAAGDSEIAGGISGHIRELQASELAAGTLAFNSGDPRFSYIAVNSKNQVVQVAEKRTIGPLATTGVFYFSTASLFLEAAEWCLVHSVAHEGLYFVSTALNFIVHQGLPVGYVKVSSDRYMPAGLPADFARRATT